MASASSSPTPTLWDVFLSFRGTDTRNGFTSHLYNSLQRHTGIRTFIDETGLQGGDVISPELRHAIKQSKIYIVVLSENYASSCWCLDELVEILECSKSFRRLVLPIFYKIDPSVVRYQLWKFGEAFGKHETRVDRKIVNNWRNALRKVGDFSGYHVRTEADIINEVVDRVLQAKPVTLEVAQHPVGINSRVARLKSSLDSGSTINGVHWIGIHGMGGVGKTTLAKAFYNQMFKSFDGSCFLADIKNICVGSECHVSLQQQLINDVLKRKATTSTTISNIGQGINLIRQLIVSLKVLVVLDDIDHQDQVNNLVGQFLAAGSVVILTTRNEDVLDRLDVKARYMVNTLDACESRQLFNQHAFKDPEVEVSSEFIDMSDKILRYAGGLPLALKVFGSSLKGAEKGGWELFIDKLQKLPIEIEVEKKLKISYDALESVHPQLQALFLDIACFFICKMPEYDDVAPDAVAVLETYYHGTVNECISVLQKRNFITIDKDEDTQVMRMHDLIRGMAKKIAGNSRLVRRGDICNLLKNKEGTKAIQGMVNYGFGGGSDYDEDSDDGMVNFDFGGEWDYNEDSDDEESDYDDEDFVICSCDATTFDRMPNLRFLRIHNVNMRGSFGKPFKDLRWLNWYVCDSFPSNFCADKLVILELRHNLIDRFAENALVLGKLKILDMSSSEKLSKTPDFNGLPCLETLNLSDCSRLVEVDVSIGNLERLGTLNLSHCIILRSLPESFYTLRALKSLNLTGCSRLKAMPMELGNIESLTHLYAVELHISQLPDSLGRLSNLVMLDLSKNRDLQSIPDTICNLRSLESLNISFCKRLEALPMQLGKIESLMELDANNLNILNLPNSIGHLSRLVRLDLSLSMHLTTLPDIICKLRSLKILEIDYFEGPEQMASGNSTQLSNLQLPFTLKKIKAYNCLSLLKLPDLSNLQQLEKMILFDCSSLREMEGLDKLMSIKKLHLEGCTSLKRLPDLSNLQQLEKMHLSQCSSLREMEGLDKLISVKEFHLSGCTSLKRLPDLSNLQQLEKMHLSQCSSLREMEGLDKLISIKELHLEGCTSMNRLPDLSGLQDLKSLQLTGGSSLRGMEGLDKLISIEELYLRGCTLMERLPDLSDLQKLKSLRLKGCSILTEIEGLEDVLSLTRIDLSGCISLERFPNLSNLQQLQTLRLTNCSHLTGIEGLEDILSITVLDLSGCIYLNRLPNLSNLQKLYTLKLTDCSSSAEIQGLGEAVDIRTLNIAGCKAMERLPNLSKLQQLMILQLPGCISLIEIQGLEEVISLTKLDLRGCISLCSLPDLSKLQNLEYLWLTNCNRLTEIESVERLISIRELHLGGCRLIKRLPNLSNMKKLKSLHVRRCSSLTEIQGLEKLNSITELDFRGCTMKTVPYVSMPPISIISLSAAGTAVSSSGLPDGALPEEAKDQSNVWKLIEVTEPSLCLPTKYPDNVRVTRLIYTDSGNAILALASNGIHLLSRWEGNDSNSFGMATASVSPQLWQPSGGFLMTNEVTDEDSDDEDSEDEVSDDEDCDDEDSEDEDSDDEDSEDEDSEDEDSDEEDSEDEDSEDALSCFALLNNCRLLISASGRSISIFDMITFKMVNTFRSLKSAVTFLAFHPQDNNIFAIGLVDSSIWIYNVHTHKNISELKGHLKRITGLAFSDVLNVLVSSGADAQVCVWNSNGWEKQNARYLQVPAGRIQAASSDTLVQFHLDQIHFLVVQETQLGIYETEKLECFQQWVPQESAAPITHATFSCDSQLIYACFMDGSLSVFTATDLRIRSRISPTAYLPPSVSTSSVHPLVIAAHPQQPNQFAVGLSEGGVRMFEHLESEEVPPPLESGSASSVLTTTADGASCLDQAVRPRILATYHRRVKQTRELKTYQRGGKKRKYGESIINVSTD